MSAKWCSIGQSGLQVSRSGNCLFGVESTCLPNLHDSGVRGYLSTLLCVAVTSFPSIARSVYFFCKLVRGREDSLDDSRSLPRVWKLFVV